jgi:DNA-binding GntR family transcriptional regulator
MLNTDAIGKLARSMSSKRTPGNVTEKTYEGLRTLILQRALEPGLVVEERRLAQMLGISRTPMRAAMERLLGENLLTRLSNGALVVRNYGFKEYLELMKVRAILETEAAALAASCIPSREIDELRKRVTELGDDDTPENYWKVDDMFHDTIARNSDNNHLCKLITDNRDQVRMCSVGKIPSRSAATCQEHLAILDALASRDPLAARQAMGDHLENVRRAFMRTLHGDARSTLD